MVHVANLDLFPPRCLLAFSFGVESASGLSFSTLSYWQLVAFNLRNIRRALLRLAWLVIHGPALAWSEKHERRNKTFNPTDSSRSFAGVPLHGRQLEFHYA